MKKLKKSIVIMLTLIFTLGIFGGCGKGSEKVSSMGRYIESELTVPNDIMHVREADMLEDGTIALIGYPKEGTGMKSYISKDAGENWEEKELKLPTVDENQTVNLNTVKFLNDGSTFIVYSIEDMTMFEEVDYENMTDEERTEYDEKMQNHYENLEFTASIIAEDGSLKEVALDNDVKKNLYECETDGNNNLFYSNQETGSLVQLDLNTGEVVKEFTDESGFVQTWCIAGDTLVTGSYEAIKTYDIKSGKEKSKLENKEGKEYNDVRLYAGREPGEVYSCTNSGVYKLEDGKKLTEIIDGTLSTFGDQNNYLQNFFVQENGEFLALFSGMDKEGSMSLINYKFDAEVAAKPENQITVYSMYENYGIKQAIVTYQKEHPDVYINVETGIAGYEYGETEINDAIKRLNTEIMAGKGPDVIILDGLPKDSYIEKGMLADISDIFGGKDNEEYFTNIIYGNEGPNGEVYSAPLMFRVPAIFAKTQSEINTIESLAANIEEISANAEGTVLNVYEPDELVYLLFNSCGNSWVSEDKSINKENIKSFLENSKKIYDAVKDKHSEKDLNRYKEEKENMAEYLTDMTYAEARYYENYSSPDRMLMSNQEILLGGLYSTQDIEVLESMKNTDKSINFHIWKGQDSNSVEGMENIGVNAKSKKLDIAKDFVKLLFGAEHQKNNFFGLSVNKTTFKNALLRPDEEFDGISTMGFGTEDGESIEIEIKKLTEEVVNEYIEKIQGLNSKSRPDKEIIKKSIDEFKAYVGGEKSIDETLKAIENKLEIYLAE